MKNNSILKRLDSMGRITIPSEFRKHLAIADFDEIEMTVEDDKIVLKKHTEYDIFGNIIAENSVFEYNGHKISKKSIIELASLAGILD